MNPIPPETTDRTVNPTPADHAKSFWNDIRWPFALIITGFAPLIYCHVAGMLMRPHYQFIALLPVAIWIIAMTIVDDQRRNTSTKELLISIVLLAVALIGLALATWAWSPWIAIVSAMVAFASMLFYTGGSEAFRNWSPAWIFCLILVPLPFGLDEDLVVALRSVTTRLSSSVLDEAGILHQAYANVIQLPGKALFVADACSGIQSLYVLLAMALFVAVLMRRSVIHSLLLLASTFALVIIENVTRIVSVAWASGHSMDWSKGTNHEILGIVLFVISAVLVLSTDQLLLFVLPESWIDLARAAVRLSERTRYVPPSSTRPLISASSGLKKAWLVMACVFPVLGLMQLPRLSGNVPPVSRLFSDEPTLAIFGEEAMPQQWLGFRRVGYEQIDRVPGDPFGQSSQRWIYEKSGLTVGFSIDYPYDGVKDLCQCYSMIGWTIEKQARLSVEELSQIATPVLATSECARAEIQRELFGQGLLLFSSLDRAGQPKVLLKDLARGDAGKRIADRWNFQQDVEELAKTAVQGQSPFTQMHVLARSFEPLTADKEHELIQFFLEARARMTPLILQSLQSGDSSQVPSSLPESREVMAGANE